MNRALPALALIVFISACAAPIATSPPQPAPPAAQTASPATACAEATLTVANQMAGVIGVSLNDGWTGTIEPKANRVIDADGVDQPPPLPWVAVVTDPKGAELGSILVQAGMNELATIANDGRFDTGAAMRPGSTLPVAGSTSGRARRCWGRHPDPARHRR